MVLEAFSIMLSSSTARSYCFILLIIVHSSLGCFNLQPGIDRLEAKSLINNAPEPTCSLQRAPRARSSSIYEPLPGIDWIRLCEFVRNKADLITGFKFHQFPLEEAPMYNALSYTWGPPLGNEKSNEEGTRYFVTGIGREVPANMMDAINTIPENSSTPYYWIDAVCINQFNITERSEQVSIMDKIYQRGETVNIWLGPGLLQRSLDRDFPANSALAYFTNLVRAGPGPRRVDLDPRDGYWFVRNPHVQEALADIFGRRWFYRLWTRQEFALAKAIRIWCGKEEIDWGWLRIIAKSMNVIKISLDPPDGQRRRLGGTNIEQLFNLRVAVHDSERLRSLHLDMTQTSENTSVTDYEGVMLWAYKASAPTTATDPRDYIFGIVGIAGVMARNLGLTFRPFEIDYSLSVAEVYHKFTARILGGSCGLQALSIFRRSEDYTSGVKTESPDREHPSWILDPAHRELEGYSSSVGRVLSKHNHSRFNVHGTDHANSHPVVIREGRLHLSGRYVGVVFGISQCFSEAVASMKHSMFALDLIRMATLLPPQNPPNGQPPLEVLSHTLQAGAVYDVGANRPDLGLNLIEDSFASALRFYALHLCRDQGVKLSELPKRLMDLGFNSGRGDVLDKILCQLEKYGFRRPTELGIKADPWAIHFLSQDFPSVEDIIATVKPYCSHPRGSLLRSNDGPPTLMNLVSLLSAILLKHRALVGSRIIILEFPVWGGVMNLLGLAPNAVMPGDHVYIVQGSLWPLIVRPTGQNNEHTFIGEAYVHGIMRGELIVGAPQVPPLKEIVIV